MPRNIILFFMLLTITALLLISCSTNNSKTKNFPLSIVKKILTGLD